MPFGDGTEYRSGHDDAGWDQNDSGWDHHVARDWRAFRSDLADRVAAIESGSSFSLVQVGEPARRVTFESRVTSLMCAITPAVAEPPGDGWLEVGDASVMEQPSAWVDLLVSAAMDAVRRHWQLPHPSFLEEPTSGDASLDPKVGVTVEDAAELDQLVGTVMTQAYGADAVRNSDGTVSVLVGTTTAFVYAPSDSEIRIHATLVQDISGRTRAAEVLGDLNRRWPSIKFLLVEDRIHAASTVQAAPLVPAHVVRAFDAFAAFLRTVDDRFAASFTGVTPGVGRPVDIEVHTLDDDLPAALLTLLDMDSASEIPLEPDLVASVCSRDRSTIAEYAEFCAEQASAWRECASEARVTDEARADECDAEAVPWDRVLRALRAALDAVGSSDNA